MKSKTKKEGEILNPESVPDSKNLTPLIVFINPKSGGQQGGNLFSKLKRLVGPAQVYDLTDGGPSKGLNAIKNLKNGRILAAGGDGTVGWVLSEIDKIQFPHGPPPVAVLPLGTGNDLARALKWGPGYEGESLLGILKQVTFSKPVLLDR
jgi:diacylglycerol kinase (ATP)